MKKVLITALILGLSVPTASFAATSKPKPASPTAAASTAKQNHEMKENKAGTQEKSTTNNTKKSKKKNAMKATK